MENTELMQPAPQTPSREIQALVRKADHLANFGTLTSLVSTAIYFVEQAQNKKIHKWVNNVTLGSVGVGIMAVFASFHYRMKASRMAVVENAALEGIIHRQAPPGENMAASVNAAQWVDRSKATPANGYSR